MSLSPSEHEPTLDWNEEKPYGGLTRKEWLQNLPTWQVKLNNGRKVAKIINTIGYAHEIAVCNICGSSNVDRIFEGASLTSMPVVWMECECGNKTEKHHSYYANNSDIREWNEKEKTK